MDPQVLDSLVTDMAHRGSSVATGVVPSAGLAEFSDNRHLASDGSLTIAGHLRLLHTERLRSLAGGASATQGFTHRHLILAAWRRHGVATLDAVEGDFAFVVWDHEERTVTAVRDRFGVMPLFMWIDPRTGVRFASEALPLARVMANPGSDPISQHDHLHGTVTAPGRSAFRGISRVLPATAVTVTSDSHSHTRYWNPEPDPPQGLTRADVAPMFRELLMASVANRAATSTRTLSQLSGGLDSSAIAAAAAASDAVDPANFVTVSAVMPGSTADESMWIDEIVVSQPFGHREFTPRTPSVDGYTVDQARAGGPWVNPIRDQEVRTAAIARETGSDMIMTGRPGDSVVDDHRLLVDMVRQGDIGRWWSTVRKTADWTGDSSQAIAINSFAEASPRRLKDLGRRLLGKREYASVAPLTAPGETEPPLWASYRSITQAMVIKSCTAPDLVAINEYEEAMFAGSAVGVTHPHLDRDLVEFIASVPVSMRPADGRTKTIVRDGFRSLLPDSVIDRKDKTIADDFITALFAESLFPMFSERFPEIPESALGLIDSHSYDARMGELRAGRPATIDDFTALWRPWTLLLWEENVPHLLR